MRHRPSGLKIFMRNGPWSHRPLPGHFCSGVPTPPVQAPPYSGVYAGDARNLFTNCWSRGSAGELTVSWNPQDEMTTGDGSPGYGVRSRYREAAPPAGVTVVCLSTNARSWLTCDGGSDG